MDERLQCLTIEEKIGQMVMLGIPGTTVGSEARAFIEDHHVGGIILFAENVVSPEQVRRLTDDLQQVAARARAPFPLFISVDQEGGRVVRMREGFTPLPAAMAIGATGSVDNAWQVGRIVGTELAAVGVNMNMAPVLDVNNNPHNPVIGLRSFGEKPETVAELGVAFMKGMRSAGVAAVVKHFPGHGDTDVDSHHALPTITHSRSRLDAIELVPFRAAIAQGVDAVMSAHITFPAVDDTPGLPSTLSQKVLTGLLRKQLGFAGLIVTDALEMKGITHRYAIGEAAVMAVQAGADIVLIAQSRYNDDGVVAVQQLVQAVRDGKIAAERIDASLRRIMQTKRRLAAATTPTRPGTGTKPTAAPIGSKNFLQHVQKVAQDAVTVVRDEGALLPLRPEKVGKVLVVRPDFENFPLTGLLRATLPRVEEVVVAVDPTAEDIQKAVSVARGANTVVAVTAGATARKGQGKLIASLHGQKTKLLVVAVGEPYDLLEFPFVPTYVVIYGAQSLHVEAGAAVLLGEHPARGRLPVSIPGLYTVGHGIRG